MSGEENQSNWEEKKKKKNRRPTKERKNSHGHGDKDKNKDNNPTEHSSMLENSVLRKQVDPETTKYFSEIANVLEGAEVDYEERSVICGNALEESKGKELELATDYILSHTMQTLLNGCDVDHLCGFLRSCGDDFPLIAVDRSGSHVAETALRALAMHIQDGDTIGIIEETLTKICQVMVAKPLDVMCNTHGSHVLRSLLCICKGIPVDFSEEFHVTKSSATLAGRLNTKGGQTGEKNLPIAQHGFPDLLIFLVEEMLKCDRKDIGTLRVDQNSSLVLQTGLKLLAGDDLALMRIIPLLLGSREEDIKEGNMIDKSTVPGIMISIKDNAFSHLMEVILEVAPDTLYNEIFTKFFRNYMFKISSDHCGSFVMQSLVSSVRCEDQLDLILEELGDKFKDLVENGKTGVIASLLAASQRLHKHERKCGQALVNAVCSTTESPTSIVPRLLFLESYIWSEDKPNWEWPTGYKMHVLGCLMLQTIFKYPTEFIQPYVTSILAMEADKILETAKSPAGGRVIESFLTSGASAKLKRKMIARLRGYFGELALHPSGSFTVEKCFDASSPSLKETIVSELLEVRSDLYKTRQGPHLSRKLDIDGYGSRPEQWKSRQESKQNSYKDFYDTFGSGSKKPESPKRRRVHSEPDNSGPVQLKGVKNIRKEMDEFLANPNKAVSVANLGFSGKRSRGNEEDRGSGKSKSKEKKSKRRKDLEA